MTQISAQEIEKDPQAFLKRLKSGESMIVVQDEQPLAEVHPCPPKESKLRPYGLAAGQIKIADDFDDPLPEEILREFEGR